MFFLEELKPGTKFLVPLMCGTGTEFQFGVTRTGPKQEPVATSSMFFSGEI
jgi:hypothetical protein